MSLSEVKTEKEFLSILKKFARKYYKKYGPINFLWLVENQWSSETDYLWEKYFGNGRGMYDYVHGNDRLANLVDEWIK